MLTHTTIDSSVSIVHVLENDLDTGINIRFVRELEFVVGLRCLEELSVLLGDLSDA